MWGIISLLRDGILIRDGVEWNEWNKRILFIYRMHSFSVYLFSLALCIPKTCTVEEALAPIIDNGVVEFIHNVEFCRLPKDKPFAAADYSALWVPITEQETTTNAQLLRNHTYQARATPLFIYFLSIF